MSLSTVGPSVFTWMPCLFPFRLLLLPCFLRVISLFIYSRFQDWIFVHSLDTPLWVRVEGRLVRYTERSSMDQQVVTVDRFTTAMASIQEALASLRQEIATATTDANGASGLTLCIAWAF